MRWLVRRYNTLDDWFERMWAMPYSAWQLLEEFFPFERRRVPAVEVAEEGNDVVVRVELPGVNPDDADVWLTDDRLTVRAERRQETRIEHQGYFHTERQYGSFQRVIPLPTEVDPDKAEARFVNGVLEVRAPKRNPREGYGRRLEIR
ncbi:MAG: Hsp20/alpha crystallin family protein [Bacillota bacterium]|jgi:Molecular chaperone (small heat shock protein)|nr:Hsp20/alpha crystallin family protein [Bacillota bacterium]